MRKPPSRNLRKDIHSFKTINSRYKYFTRILHSIIWTPNIRLKHKQMTQRVYCLVTYHSLRFIYTQVRQNLTILKKDSAMTWHWNNSLFFPESLCPEILVRSNFPSRTSMSCGVLGGTQMKIGGKLSAFLFQRLVSWQSDRNMIWLYITV